MASIVPIVIRCIDYLAYGSIFTRVMFRPKIKLDVFFPFRKAGDERWEVVPPPPTLSSSSSSSLRSATSSEPRQGDTGVTRLLMKIFHDGKVDSKDGAIADGGIFVSIVEVIV